MWNNTVAANSWAYKNENWISLHDVRSYHSPERSSFLRAPWTVTEGFYRVPGGCCRCARRRGGGAYAYAFTWGFWFVCTGSCFLPRNVPPTRRPKFSPVCIVRRGDWAMWQSQEQRGKSFYILTSRVSKRIFLCLCRFHVFHLPWAPVCCRQHIVSRSFFMIRKYILTHSRGNSIQTFS